jgi:plasmid stability protein
MPVNLSIKNVPDDVACSLRYRAALNQRSLQEELLDILKQAAEGQTQVTFDGLLAGAQRKKPALDEAASRVRAVQDEEQAKTAKRFEDLLGRADDTRPESGSGSQQ